MVDIYFLQIGLLCFLICLQWSCATCIIFLKLMKNHSSNESLFSHKCYPSIGNKYVCTSFFKSRKNGLHSYIDYALQASIVSSQSVFKNKKRRMAVKKKGNRCQRFFSCLGLTPLFSSPSFSGPQAGVVLLVGALWKYWMEGPFRSSQWLVSTTAI